MNKTQKNILGIILGISLGASSIKANTVTFADYAGTIMPYMENEFIVTAAATPNGGAWGVTQPNTISSAMTLSRGVDITQTRGEIDITRGGGELL